MAATATLIRYDDGFTRKKWNMEECRFLVNSGLLIPGKYELIEGEIISKMGQGRLHIAAITRIIAALIAIFGEEAIQSQAQIGIGELDPFSDPEPDIAVLRGSVRDYLDREPDPATEILLVVEAAHSSLPGDKTTKARIYARHGVPEYWVLAVTQRELILHRDPDRDGYLTVQTFGEDDMISPLASPSSTICVADMLP